MLRRATTAVWERAARRAARRYVAGSELEDALSVCERLSHKRIHGTIAYWNDDGEDGRAVLAIYLDGLAAIRASGLNAYSSIKVTALDLDEGMVRQVIAAGAESGVRVHFDSMWPETAEPTRRLTDKMRDRGVLGYTLPGRWKRSVEDADWAVDENLIVRVVKGQWPDPASELDAREGFLRVVERLDGRARHVAVATHDPPLAAHALDTLLASGTSCELELLYGLPARRVVELARQRSVPVRSYVPYGKAWLPYSLGYLKRNPSVLWWMAKDTVLG